MKTDKKSVIGCYCPDQWEDMADKLDHRGHLHYKDVVSGKPFLFYWVADQIQIIKQRDDIIVIMGSDNIFPIFLDGLCITPNKNKKSEASACDTIWVHP